jgi:hypothetical protein
VLPHKQFEIHGTDDARQSSLLITVKKIAFDDRFAGLAPSNKMKEQNY